MEEEFEKPDWSLRMLEVGSCDLGWAEGTLVDGRPYYLERWQEPDSREQFATFYFSRRYIEDSSYLQLSFLLLDSEVFAVDSEPLPVDAGPVSDSLGQDLFSVNITLSDPLERYAHLTVPIMKYEK